MKNVNKRLQKKIGLLALSFTLIISSASYNKIDVQAFNFLPKSSYNQTNTTKPAFSRPSLKNALNGVEITWKALSGVDKYNAYRKQENGIWNKLAEVAELNYIDTTAENNGIYSYAVVSYADDKQVDTTSFDKNSASVTFYAPPSDLKASNGKNMIHLEWTSNDGADRYRIYRKEVAVFQPKVAESVDGIATTEDAQATMESTEATTENSQGITEKTIKTTESAEDKPWMELALVTGNSYDDTSVISGDTYAYTICRVDEKDQEISAYDLNGTSIAYYDMPTGITLTNTADGVQVTWKEVRGASNYRIYRSLVPEKGANVEPSTETTSEVIEETTGAIDATEDKASELGTTETQTTENEVPEEATTQAGPIETTESASDEATTTEVVPSTEAAEVDPYAWNQLASAAGLEYVDQAVESGKRYKYTVSCLDDNGNVETTTFDSEGKEKLYIAAPSNVQAKNVAKGISLTWDKSEGASNYRVLRKNAEGKWKKLVDTKDNKIVDEKVESGKEYVYTVKCVNKDGSKDTSGYNDNGISNIYYSVPKELKVTSTKTGLKVSWKAVKGIEKYQIYRTLEKGDWEPLAKVTGTEYEDQTVASGKEYKYTVSCLSGDGTIEVSAYNTTGKGRKFIAAPTNIQTRIAAKRITITWNKSEGAVKYRVLRKNAEGKWKKVVDTQATKAVDKNVESGKSYVYTVKCINKDGSKDTSAFDKEGTKQLYLAPIAKKLNIKNKSNGVELTWSKVAGASGYIIYRAVGNGNLNRYETISDASTTKFLDKVDTNGQSYKYAVQAKSQKDGNLVLGDYTEKKTVYLEPVEIDDLMAIDEGFYVSWDENYQADSYMVQYGTDSKFKKNSIETEVYWGTETTITNLKSKKYYVRVRVRYDEGGKSYYSAWSDAKSVTPKESVTKAVVSSSGNKHTYILNANTGKFHIPGCRDVNRMKESNKREVTETRDEMISRYDPCMHCNP